MARILIVDDEPALCRALAMVLKARGHDALIAHSGEEGVARRAESGAELAILDLRLPGISGIETFSRLRADDPDLPCIIITAHGTVPTAVDAMKAGAEDFLTKPFDNDHLLLVVERALERRATRQRLHELQEDLSARTAFAGFVGKSPAVQRLLRQLARIAQNDEPVLIAGETGTGKELAARSVNAQSLRAGRPLVAVNCGAITPTLAGSELFGHIRGAFTDARQDRRGFFEQADTGSLLLDEVGELSLDIQATLLRVLEDGQVTRLGAERSTPVDVRLIAATNRNLDDEVRRERFRIDLFYRLNVFRIDMPPLRQRPEDLPAREEPVMVHQHPRVVPEIEQQWAAMRDLGACLQDRRERRRDSALPHGHEDIGDRSFDLRELLHACDPAIGQVVDDEQQVDIRVWTRRAAPDRSEHGQ